ncbi:MAG: aldo/keto reductase [Patescibacteria group bacterium]|nr:aldo/keto reductase [Patescibacteria group bacterium]
MQTKSGKPLFPIGIGTWNIGGVFNPNDPTAKYKGAEPVYGNEETEIEAIRYSISNGQNHIDCAELYGAFYTDEIVGRAIVGLERTDLYIADKLWRTSLEKRLVWPTVQKMLEKLGTNYLDMLYIHAPFKDANWQEAISQIDELIDTGIVRDFGVSNFTVADIKLANKLARHPITANQMNFNVLHKIEVTDDLKVYCQQNNIQLIAYQPIKRKEVLGSKIIQTIADKHDATPAQIALAWLLNQNALTIPKAINHQHIDENIAAAKIKLSESDLAELDKEI